MTIDELTEPATRQFVHAIRALNWCRQQVAQQANVGALSIKAIGRFSEATTTNP